jgi:hypothetical protein
LYLGQYQQFFPVTSSKYRQLKNAQSFVYFLWKRAQAHHRPHQLEILDLFQYVNQSYTLSQSPSFEMPPVPSGNFALNFFQIKANKAKQAIRYTTTFTGGVITLKNDKPISSRSGSARRDPLRMTDMIRFLTNRAM